MGCFPVEYQKLISGALHVTVDFAPVKEPEISSKNRTYFLSLANG
jgi:hypothetical protein